jgi:enoyl-CoA hydratase
MSEPVEPRVLVHLEEREGGARIARVVINNASKLNSLNQALMRDLILAVDDLSKDDRLRAVVLTGAGEKAFIGGADITEMAALDDTTATGFITLVHQSCAVLRTLPVPVIGRLQGFTLGAGMEIAAACDLRVAAQTARFGMPEVKLGIPSVVEAALLPGLIGWGRTRELLLLGETFSADEVARWGFLNRVVPAAALDEVVEEWVRSLVAAGPKAVRLQKQLIGQWEDLSMSSAITAGIDAFGHAWQSDEPARMMAAFLAQRRAATALNNDRPPISKP